MAYRNSKGDVEWVFPGRKRPFGYSTVATSDLIAALAANHPDHTVTAIRDLVNYDDDAQQILDQYIGNGYAHTPIRELNIQ